MHNVSQIKKKIRQHGGTHDCNSSSWEVGGGGSEIQGQPELHLDPVSNIKKKRKSINSLKRREKYKESKEMLPLLYR